MTFYVTESLLLWLLPGYILHLFLSHLVPKKGPPGRKPGAAYGKKGHRPTPTEIDERKANADDGDADAGA